MVQVADIAGRWEIHDLMRPVARKAFDYAESPHLLRSDSDARVFAAG